MRAIIVDDEPTMLRKFERYAEEIREMELVGKFRDPKEALAFARAEAVELAFLDVGMPVMNGMELGRKLREIKPDILLVYITAYDEYLREANEMGADYYILKPYSKEMLETTFANMRFLAHRQRKPVFMQMFGRFNVFKNGKPIALQGKAKEILALVAVKQGKEISNEEIFLTIWENVPYSHVGMKTYFSALRRLKERLKKEHLEGLLISTPHGQMADTTQFDCDYYDMKNGSRTDRFDGEFLIEYSWSEDLLADLADHYL